MKRTIATTAFGVALSCWLAGFARGAAEPGARSPNLAIRDGKWKLLINADGTGTELYDLATDPNETKNLATEKPDEAKRLRAVVLAWRQTLP